MAHTAREVEIVELDEAQAADMFEQVCQQEMGISAEEFLVRWDRGDYEGIDYDTVPGLVGVWMNLPFVRTLPDAGA